MKTVNTISLLVIAITGWIALGIQRPVQEPAKPVEAKKNVQEQDTEEDGTGIAALKTRVGALEQRVDQLESLIFSSVKLDVAQAERHLEDAHARFKDSRELFNRGLLNSARYNNDKFLYEQAVQELKLAKASTNQRQLANKLDQLHASQRVSEAKHNLKFTRNLFHKGYASRDQVDRARQDVELSERELELVISKLKAAESLQAVNPAMAAEYEKRIKDKDKDK